MAPSRCPDFPCLQLCKCNFLDMHLDWVTEPRSRNKTTVVFKQSVTWFANCLPFRELLINREHVLDQIYNYFDYYFPTPLHNPAGLVEPWPNQLLRQGWLLLQGLRCMGDMNWVLTLPFCHFHHAYYLDKLLYNTVLSLTNLKA